MNVDDRIVLCLASDNQTVMEAVKKWADNIKAEVLATDLVDELAKPLYAVDAKVNKLPLNISLAKAKK